jgi:ribosomal protein L3
MLSRLMRVYFGLKKGIVNGFDCAALIAIPVTIVVFAACAVLSIRSRASRVARKLFERAVV